VILHPLPYLPFRVFFFYSFIQNTRKVTEEGYNNCEHFAHYCKTGNPISCQVENLPPFLGGTQGMAVVDALCINKIHTENSLKLAIDETQKYINNTLENISNFWRGNDDDDK
ncbi:MAG: hypothetical protein V7K59_08225, partial [Nostoc sp.]